MPAPSSVRHTTAAGDSTEWLVYDIANFTGKPAGVLDGWREDLELPPTVNPRQSRLLAYLKVDFWEFQNKVDFVTPEGFTPMVANVGLEKARACLAD